MKRRFSEFCKKGYARGISFVCKFKSKSKGTRSLEILCHVKLVIPTQLSRKKISFGMEFTM